MLKSSLPLLGRMYVLCRVRNELKLAEAETAMFLYITFDKIRFENS